MKKFISIFVSVVMLMSFFAVPSLAAEEDSALLETALAEVKTKVDIPAEYTEFESSSQNSEDGTVFDFTWSEEGSSKNIDITVDEQGRILNYSSSSYYYGYNDESKIAKYDTETVKNFAYEKIKKMMPEAFTDDDTLVIENYSYSYGRYSIQMCRKKNDIFVYGQDSFIDIIENDNGELELSDAYLKYDYDAQFEEQGQEIENIEDNYKNISPAILQYQNEYDIESDDYKIFLKYRNDNKYMSAYTGEEVKMKTEDRLYYENSASTGGVEFIADKNASFTEQEQAELDNVKGLKSADDIFKIIKNIDILNIGDDVTVSEYHIYKNDYYDNYFINITLSNDMEIRANAVTGEIESISNYIANENCEDEQPNITTEVAIEKITKFLNEYAPDSEQYKLDGEPELSGSISLLYQRYVNDIICPSDVILLYYNMVDDELISYNINYTEKEFPKPDNIISSDEAYNIMLKSTTIEKTYIPTDDGYKLCYSLPYWGDIDAFSSEESVSDYEEEYSHSEYTDISGHWCEKIVKELEQSEIAFNGDLFKPDEAIIQSDFFRLVSCVVLTPKMAMRSGENAIYDTLTQTISPMFEENTQSNVTRENACIYFARILNLGKYVENPGVFKTGFADNDKISSNALGSVALLSNVGVIGNSGKFRPNDNITYAEASVMLYNILKNNLYDNLEYRY